MVERYAISQFEQAARLLPVRWQRIALQLPDWQKEQVEELRLRAGHPMTVLLPRGEQVVGEEAVVTQGDIELLCDTVTGYSRYAAAETMARGYITAKGGFRIGLCGTAVVQEGRSTNLRSLSSACVRIAREMPGLADDLAPQLFQDGAFRSTLIIAPPGLGKTTLLRDLVRCLSDGAENIPAHRVALVDERGEVAVMVQGTAQMEIGCHTDVMDGCPKAVAIPMLLRSANPQIIAVDEITQAAARIFWPWRKPPTAAFVLWPLSMRTQTPTCSGGPCCASCSVHRFLKKPSVYKWRTGFAATGSRIYEQQGDRRAAYPGSGRRAACAALASIPGGNPLPTGYGVGPGTDGSRHPLSPPAHAGAPAGTGGKAMLWRFIFVNITEYEKGRNFTQLLDIGCPIHTVDAGGGHALRSGTIR